MNKQPKRLYPGDLISLAAPAHAVKPEHLQRGRDFFQSHGFRTRITDNALNQKADTVLHRFAGPDEARINTFNAELNNPEVRAICCLSGGYGTSRILHGLDYAALRRDPKIITGYSDITALHSALFSQCGMVSLHSPNVDSLPLIAITKEAWIKSIQGDLIGLSSSSAAPFVQDNPMQTWRSGKAQGFLVGGNLSLTAALTGTPHAIPQDRDVILFLEDVGEFAYRVDMMLQQVKLAGTFNRVKGVILGQFSKRKKQENEPDTLMADVLRAFFQDFNFPILANAPFGHVKKNLPLAHGARVELDADAQSLQYIQPLFWD